MGVLHRDIKPENILFSAGHPIVADFGIAKAISTAGGEHLTRIGFPPGTPGYMSPEQAAGMTDLDPSTDVYALACLTCEMLVGQDAGTVADGGRGARRPTSWPRWRRTSWPTPRWRLRLPWAGCPVAEPRDARGGCNLFAPLPF